MKNSIKSMTALIKNKLENENGFDTLLAGVVGVEDYYTEEFNQGVGDGVDFDLLFNFATDSFESVQFNTGGTFAQLNDCVVIASLTDVKCEEELIKAVEAFLESQAL